MQSVELNYGSLTDQRTEFCKQLKKLGLKLNIQDWICTESRQTLDEYSLYHDMRAEDGKHPSMTAHEQWTKTILMPLLTKQGILCKL